MQILEMAQNSPEWLKFRKNKIGASDAPVIMGVSPWKTPIALWDEKIGNKESYQNERMREGQVMEKEARISFCYENDIEMLPLTGISSENEWAIASFDGMDVERKNLVEIKCPGDVDHNTALAGEIPDKYFPQLQHQLYVSELDFGYYYSYKSGSEFTGTKPSTKTLKIYRDDKYIAKMLKLEKDFYDCIMSKIPPQLTELDYKHMDTTEWQKASDLYLDILEQIKYLEKKEKELKDQLILLSGGSNAKGARAKLSKIIRMGSIDYNAIPELKNRDLESFRKPPTEYWKITKYG